MPRTVYRLWNPDTGRLDGDKLPIDLAANAQSLGARVIRAADVGELARALVAAREHDGPVLISIETDPLAAGPKSNSWWDVPVAEVSELDSVNTAREEYTRRRAQQRRYLSGGS